MTNKMPVVGKRYEHRLVDGVKVSIKKITDGKIYLNESNPESWTYRDFFNNFRELPEDNKKGMVRIFPDFAEEPNQPTEALKAEMAKESEEGASEVDRAFATVVGNPDGSCTMVDFTEVSEVERALEELKYHAQIEHYFNKGAALEDIKTASRNLIKALDAGRNMSKPEPEIDMKEEGCKYPNCRGGCCIGKDGNPVGWEKKECVEPVSIWKDVSELPDGTCQVILKLKYRARKPYYCNALFNPHVGVDGIFYTNGSIHSSEGYCSEYETISLPIPLNDIEEWCYNTDFINSFEQMQKDIEELKTVKKEKSYRCYHDYVLQNQDYNSDNILISQYECSICHEVTMTAKK